MFREKTRLYKVYHIHLKDNPDVNDGYVGITRKSLAWRLSEHFCSRRPIGSILRGLARDAIVIDQLAMLPKEEALDMEFRLRPARNIGWNCMAGGDRATVLCPGCGKRLPKRRSGAMCEKCNPTRFMKGQLPHNYGKGRKMRVTSPTGEVFEPEAFGAFCRKHGLTAANLYAVAKGRRHHSGGWKAEYVSQ